MKFKWLIVHRMGNIVYALPLLLAIQDPYLFYYTRMKVTLALSYADAFILYFHFQNSIIHVSFETETQREHPI